MITAKITSEKMTEGQQTQIKRVLEDGLRSVDLEALGLSKDESQEILKKGDLVQAEMKDSIVKILQKHSIADKRFGPVEVLIPEFVVPEDYVHAEQLRSFKKKNEKDFYYYNDDITDKNFVKATVALVPGKKYEVSMVSINAQVASEDCMAVLKSKGAVLVGAQGVSLVWPHIRSSFPKGKALISFDEKDSLWKDAGGYHRVPFVVRLSGGDWRFNLGAFVKPWDDVNFILVFREIIA